MGHVIKNFIMMVAQILKKLIILAVIALVLAAAYLAWTKFIKKTQYHTTKASTNRAEKQGIKVK